MDRPPRSSLNTARPNDDARGRFAMRLLLGAEGMYFLSIMSAWLVLKQHGATAEPESLHYLLAAGGIVLLAAGALGAFVGSPGLRVAIQIVLGLGFCATVALEYAWQMRTVVLVAADGGTMQVYRGKRVMVAQGKISIDGSSRPLTPNFDIHAASVLRDGNSTRFEIDRSDIRQEITNGPWKNNFFACYYLASGSLMAHVIAAIVASILAGRSAWPMWALALGCSVGIVAVFYF
jgi:heme/copper-type cytochrome/quinol oxidase subunit 3